MARQEPTCPLCGAALACDMCGPIEGGYVWVRAGEKASSVFREGEPGDWVFVCDRCAGRKR